MSRRISVSRHQAWRESLAGGPAFDPEDDLLEAAPEPIHRRSEGEIGRLMAVLDEIADRDIQKGGDA